ncbi:MAG: hypothetical protein RBG13Loki_3484 [Promethearchaeota archaeon CR_4]|nr:MAG: hypothetical protein RBG13Loki_3484 [Candidatus Lokiarchaeota archaeon CR_4]
MKDLLKELLDDPVPLIRNKAKRGLEVLCEVEQKQEHQTLDEKKDAKLKAKKSEIEQLKGKIPTLQQKLQEKLYDIQELSQRYA